ncbi:hypothetical protein ACF08M_13800 [Streptomyces sp. NPDC015032]|uniref:hypothetical protein n=1 Tax=Streptomyces sp. NPDC015032 TaxID=3364937 RepID=UPI0037010D28
MPSVDRRSREAVVHHLYEGPYAYISTGPRRHKDWTCDVLVMARVPDPRGWAGVVPASEAGLFWSFADH